MKKLLAFVGLLTFCGAAMGQVGAETDFTPTGVTFRAGLGIPLDDELIDDKPIAFAFGFDYEFDFRLFGPGEVFGAFDWIAAEDGLYSLSLNKRIFTGEGELFGQPGASYIFLGVGGSSYDRLELGDMSIIFRGGLGYELISNTVVEFGGWVGGDSNGINTTTLFATIGYRFR